MRTDRLAHDPAMRAVVDRNGSGAGLLAGKVRPLHGPWDSIPAVLVGSASEQRGAVLIDEIVAGRPK
jgi:hypothetical protein